MTISVVQKTTAKYASTSSGTIFLARTERTADTRRGCA